VLQYYTSSFTSMLQFASAHPAAGIPHHITNGYKVLSGQIQSNGPLEKCTPQSIVAATLEHGKPSTGRKRGDDTAVDNGFLCAPSSSNPAIEHIARSDIVLMNPTQAMTRRATGGMPNVQGFHAVNGLDTSVPVKFAAVATYAGMGNAMDLTKDNVGAANIAGTQTLVNTGDRTLYAGQLAWVSEFPYKVKDSNGRYIPGVKEIGHADDQFRPATYGLSYANVTTIMNMIQTSMEAIYKKHRSNLDFGRVDKDIRNELNLMCIRDELPMFDYAFVYFAYLCYVDLFTFASASMFSLIHEFIDHYLRFKEKNKKKFDVALDIGLDVTISEKHLTAQDLPTAPTNYTSLGTDSNFATWHRVVGRVVQEALKSLQAVQHDWMNARVIGLIINTAEPGKPFDVLIRAYHN
jgi:hypothetical protein